MSFTADDFGSGASVWEAEFDAPLPGNQAGSWIPTPPAFVFPNAPAIEPFDTPAGDGGDVDPGFGMGYGVRGVFSAESVAAGELDRQLAPMGLLGDDEDAKMENSFGTLGAEAWYTQLAKTAATIAADLAEKAGILPEVAYEPLRQAGLLPVAVEEPVETIKTMPVVVEPERPAWLMPAVIGGGALLVFMMFSRRRR